MVEDRGVPDVMFGGTGEDQFTTVPNSLIRKEPNMTYTALGLLTTLMSNANGKWRSNNQILVKRKKITKYNLNKTLTELTELGYLKRIFYRGKGGRVMGSLWCYTWVSGHFDEEAICSRLSKYGMEIHDSVNNPMVDFPANRDSEGGETVQRKTGTRNTGTRKTGTRYLAPNKTNSNKTKRKKKNRRGQAAPSPTKNKSLKGSDPRHQKVVDHFFRRYKKIHGVDLVCDSSDFSQLKKLLKQVPEAKASFLCQTIHRFLDSPDPFHQKQGHPLRYWASNFNAFTTPDKIESSKSPNERVKDLVKSMAVPKLKELVYRTECIAGRDSVHPFLDLFEFVTNTQSKNLDYENPDGLWSKLGTGSLLLVEQYLDWIEEQDWIGSCSPAMFKSDSKLFLRFKQEWAKGEVMGRDPLTGKEVK